MGKLHEVLAVETDLKATADKLLKETLSTFGSKAGHFESSHVQFKADAENAPAEAPEFKPMVDRVRDKLLYTTKAVSKYFDSVMQKESTNQKAKADLVLDDETVLATSVPATMLLGLEAKLKEVRAIYEAAPTLAPGEDWQKAEDEGKGLHKAISEKVRTSKQEEHQIIVPPTREHPAQVARQVKDIRVGKVVTTKTSSLFTPGEKSDVLARIDSLIRAAKKARMRANDTTVEKVTIGEKIFDYIHKDIVN